MITKIVERHRAVLTYPPNAARRLRSLARLYLFQLLKILGIRTVVQLGSHSKVEWDRKQKAVVRVAYMNPPDYMQWQFWSRILGPRSIFVDVGANVGLYSILAAEKGAAVIAFEPDPANLDVLIRNIRLNDYEHLIDVRAVALGPTAGQTTITSGLGPLTYVSSGPFRSTSAPGKLERRQVRMSTLDDEICHAVTGMKIDVEGFELSVLQGASRALSSGFIPLIQLEWNDLSTSRYGVPRTDIDLVLESFGYRILYFSKGGNVAQCSAHPAADVLAVNKDGSHMLGALGIEVS